EFRRVLFRSNLESAVGERVVEALGAVLGQRKRVDSGDLGYDGIRVVADLFADVCTGRDAHAVVVTEDGDAGGEGTRELAVDVDHGNPRFHRLDRDLGECGAVSRQQHDRVDLVVDETLDLADLQVGVVRSFGDPEVDVRVFL